jgi:phage tail-like protein
MMRKIFLMLVIITFAILMVSTLAYSPASGKKDPLPSSNFLVEIDGITTASFIHVEGLDSETEVIEYRVGNEKNEINLVPGLTRVGPIILKRYLDDNNELWEWFEENRDDPVDRKSMSIVIMNRNREEQVRYNFQDCWPSEYYVEPLSSNPSDIAVEVIVIQCESMDRVGDDR